MKKIVKILCTSLFVLLLFVSSINPVQAEEPDDDCECHELVPLSGAERNKIVANLISSIEFQSLKQKLENTGENWNGAGAIEVVKPAEGMTMVGAPFTSHDGVVSVYVFINGVFVGKSPQ